MVNLTKASRELFTRPPDECFESLDVLSEHCSKLREQSLDRMRAEALERGANAIVGVRFTTSTVMQGAAEILAYGTAVVIEKA